MSYGKGEESMELSPLLCEVWNGYQKSILLACIRVQLSPLNPPPPVFFGGTHIDTGVVVVAKGDAWGREADGRRGAVLTGTEQHGGVVDVEEW